MMRLLLPTLVALTLLFSSSHAVHARQRPPTPLLSSSPSSSSPSSPSSSFAPSARPAPSGSIFLHDSSGVVFDNVSSFYYMFASGQPELRPNELIAVVVSTDGFSWKRGPDFLLEMPSWARAKVPNTEAGWWAPDIAFFNGYWHLYYAISSGGSQTSCIGLAVNKALDSSSPGFKWIDAGPVLCSTPSFPFNCIDMHVFTNPNDGTHWMNWGSYWHGLYAIELQGSPIASVPVGVPINIATHDVEIHPIEASWVQPWPSTLDPTRYDFWLFVDWEYCCRGLNSTYDIRVGRSTTGPAGPYYDRAGVAMVDGGGSEFLGTQLESDGKQIGPGQIGFPWPIGGGPATGPSANASAPIVSFFYYDRLNKGQFTIGQAKVVWEGEGANAWPVVSERL